MPQSVNFILTPLRCSKQSSLQLAKLQLFLDLQIKTKYSAMTRLLTYATYDLGFMARKWWELDKCKENRQTVRISNISLDLTQIQGLNFIRQLLCSFYPSFLSKPSVENEYPAN
jgi:hypothetical protein